MSENNSVPAGAAPNLPARATALALSDVMALLYASEINCGIESFWDGGFTLFLGDNMNGHKWERTISVNALPQAGNMLTVAALSLYPLSEFTVRLGFGGDYVNETIGWTGLGSSHPDIFKCEFCGAEHIDCTLIDHADDCLITQCRGALAKTTTPVDDTEEQGRSEAEHAPNPQGGVDP